MRVTVDQATDGSTDAVDMDNFTGATSLNLYRTVGRNDVKDVALTTAVTFTELDATADTTVTFKASGLTGSADATTVTMNGVTAASDIELAGAIETVTIKTTGAASSLADLDLDAATTTLNINADEKLTVATTFTNTGVETLNITGDSLVTITPSLSTATTKVDASAQTAGGAKVKLGTNTEFIGGAGDDTVDATANTTKTVTGGTGADMIVFTASTNYATTAAKVSGFETLRASGVSASYNVAYVTGATALQAETTAGTLTFTNVTTQSVRANNSITTLALTLADSSGTADALTLTIDDSDTTAGAITLGNVTSAGLETLNIVTGDTLASGTDHVISDFDSSTSLKTINVSGTSDLELTDIADMASGAKVDATGFARILTVAGLGAGDTVIGGSKNDSISLAYGSLGTTTVLTGGAGDDTVTVTGNGSDMVDGDFAAMTGIDNIVIGSATTTSVTLAGYAQAAIGAVDYNTDGRLDITAAALTTGGTIDASALTTKGVNISVTTTIANGAGDQTVALSGGAGSDTITLVAVDTADSNSNDDIDSTITPGSGIDTISYTLTSGDSDDVLTIVSTATTAANADIITGFATTVDKFDYNGTLTNGAVTDDVANATLAGAIAAQASYGAYIISTDIANSGSNTSGTAFADLLGSNATSLATNFAAFTAQLVASGGIFNSTISGLDSAIASGESALLSFDNGTGSVVVRFVNTTTTANTVLATELSLVGVFTNTVLAADDFA